ncbi:MAG: BrxA family protein [Anaerolineae bacterium]
MTHPHGDTTWRATGPYLPTNASKTGLLDETRQFLVTYARRRDVDATARELLDGALPQRSRETRRTIVRIIETRLTRWNPPDWVLSDLVAFAAAHDTDTLKSALLLHAARQDVLLVDAVLHVIVPRWAEHTLEISRADVQRYLDAAEPLHPEIAGWSRETREKLTGNLLSILRDYGLLVGTAAKRIVAPIVPPGVVAHLARLLIAEGISPEELPLHPDWRLWLWEPERAARALANLPGSLEMPHA